MNVATAIPSSLPLASGNANDYIAPAIPAGAPLPPNAVILSGREYSTRKQIRLTQPDLAGVATNELAQSKRRKADVEAISIAGTLQAQMAAYHAVAQANHVAVMAQFDHLKALIAKNSNYPTVGLLLCLNPNPELFADICCVLVYTQRVMNHQNPDAWGRLQIENVYVAPAGGAVAAPRLDHGQH
jgi:hypothetical protein